MSAAKSYDEIVDFIAAGTTPETVLAFRPSQEAQRRVSPRCNAWKGTDVGSIDLRTGNFVPLFHPRRQRWDDHFRLRGVVIEPLTPEAEVTARLLRLNPDKRIVERDSLATAGRYPRTRQAV